MKKKQFTIIESFEHIAHRTTTGVIAVAMTPFLRILAQKGKLWARIKRRSRKKSRKTSLQDFRWLNTYHGNSAQKKGQAVFNYGYYDSVDSNCWSDKNPSADNDILTAAHLSGPNDYISDSNPLGMILSRSKFIYDVNEITPITACFMNNNGSIFEGELFDLSNLNLYHNIHTDFSNEKIGPCNVSVDVTINSQGIHMIFAEFYGYSIFTLLFSILKNNTADFMMM